MLLNATGCARPDMDKVTGMECMIWFTLRLNLAVLHGELCDTICAGVLVLSSHDHVKIALLEFCSKRPLHGPIICDRTL